MVKRTFRSKFSNFRNLRCSIDSCLSVNHPSNINIMSRREKAEKNKSLIRNAYKVLKSQKRQEYGSKLEICVENLGEKSEWRLMGLNL